MVVAIVVTFFFFLRMALVVTSLLIFLCAHCLIKRKGKGMRNWLINQRVNYKSETTLIID